MEGIKLTKEELIKAEVIVASGQLFKRYGYQKTTMEDIAKAIGRGKSTLYYYYKSKEEVFEAIVLKEVKELLSILNKKVDKAITADEKLKVYVLTAYQVVKEKAVLNDVIFNEMVQSNGAGVAHPTMIEHLEKFNQKWFLIIRNIISFGVDNKEFNVSLDEVDKVSNVIFMSSLCTVLMLAHNESATNDKVMSVSELLISFVDVLIKGLK